MNTQEVTQQIWQLANDSKTAQDIVLALLGQGVSKDGILSGAYDASIDNKLKQEILVICRG